MTAPETPKLAPELKLDLRLCHGNTMCVAMAADMAASERRNPTREQVARMLTAVQTGRCTYCRRPVR